MALDLRPAAPPLRRDARGAIRIGGSRVTLESVLRAYQDGESAEGILERFPSLDLASIHATIAWYLLHVDEAEAYLAGVRKEGAKNRARAARGESRPGLVARLRARRPR